MKLIMKTRKKFGKRSNDYTEERTLSCFCQGICPHGMEYGTCQTKPGGKCFTSVKLDIDVDGTERPVLLYGCLPPHEMSLFQCRATLVAQKDRKNIKCCDEYDLCNKHLLPVVQTTQHPDMDYFHGMTVKLLISSITVCLIFFAVGLAITYLKIKKEIRQRKKSEHDAELASEEVANNDDGPNVLETSIGDDSGIRIGAESTYSIAESDRVSELVQRTISRQITFEIMIAKGKFSEVWRAKWRGDKVAVKIYNQQEEESWRREIEIFQSPLLRHEHILGYIAADVEGRGPTSKRYVITEYHCYGSLRDFLKYHTVTPEEVLHMTKGLASALNHLHTEIIGSSRKPCITHNNINSKNILVKKDKVCCFGNFSRTTRFFSSENRIDSPNNILNSEIRYLAPEFLEETFNLCAIESYKMGDVYSFSLILWEIAQRCELPSLLVGEYEAPFEAQLASEVSWEGIKELVAVKKVRPNIKDEWESDPVLRAISKLMSECWSATPSVRLTSLRIKKTLFKVYNGK